MRTRVLCAALAMLLVAPAVADEERPLRVMSEAALGLAYDSDGSYRRSGEVFDSTASLSLRLSALHPVVSGGLEATALGDAEGVVLAGLGVLRPFRGWNTLLLAVAGVHGFETFDKGDGRKGHILPAAGVRASFFRFTGRSRTSLTYGFSTTVFADLRREKDPVVEKRVGGITAFITLDLGLAFRL